MKFKENDDNNKVLSQITLLSSKINKCKTKNIPMKSFIFFFLKNYLRFILHNSYTKIITHLENKENRVGIFNIYPIEKMNVKQIKIKIIRIMKQIIIINISNSKLNINIIPNIRH